MKIPVLYSLSLNRSGADLFRSLLGEMSERLKEPVLKTGDVQTSVGSNPTLSAMESVPQIYTIFILYAEVPKRPKGLPC